jgi:hypothetical protein
MPSFNMTEQVTMPKAAKTENNPEQTKSKTSNSVTNATFLRQCREPRRSSRHRLGTFAPT